MGTSKLPKDESEAGCLIDLCLAPIEAREADDLLASVFLEDSNLSKALLHARRSDGRADVRSLVVNSVASLYFTGMPPESIASAEAASLLRGRVGTWERSEDDIFFALARVRTKQNAEASFAEALDLSQDEVSTWLVARDPNGYDFVARDAGGRTFRLSAIYDYVVQVHPANVEMYDPVFASVLRSNKAPGR